MAADRSGTPLVVIAVAIAGLLSTVGAAALGGYWANENVKRQFESQRTAQIQDQRRVVYVDFIRATTQACDASQTGNDAEIQKTAVEVVNQEARVLLIASPNTREPLTKLTDYVIRGEGCENDQYFGLRNAFIERAQQELQ